MALTDARVIRTQTFTESKDNKQAIQLVAVEEYLIVSSTKDPNFGDILNDTATYANLGNNALPQLSKQIVVGGRDLYCVSRELKYYKDNERAVLMTVRYESREQDSNEPEKPSETEPDTWQRITVSSQSITKPAKGWNALADVPGPAANDTGTTALNSAKEPVDGLEEDYSLVKLSYTNTAVASPNFEQLLQHVNVCNSTTFLGGGEYSVRVMGFSAEYDQKNQVWSVTLEFLYNPDSWVIKYYDVGFNTNVGGERQAVLDKKGNPVSKPVPLDNNGGELPIGSDPYELELYPYPKADLTQIFTACGI